MKMETEVLHDTSLNLIIGNPNLPIVKALASYLQKKEVRVVISTHIPPKINPATIRCFCFTGLAHLAHDATLLSRIPHVVLISSLKGEISSSLKQTLQLMAKHYPHIKTAFIPEGTHEIETIIQRLLFFSFDESLNQLVITSSAILRDDTGDTAQNISRESFPLPSPTRITLSIIRQPLRFIRTALLLIFLAHLVFLPALVYATVQTFLTSQKVLMDLTTDEPPVALGVDPFSYPSTALKISRKMYDPFRKGWLFVGLASYPERVFDITERVIDSYQVTHELRDDMAIMFSKIMDPQSLSQDTILEKKTAVEANINRLTENVQTLRERLPSFVMKYKETEDKIEKAEAYLTMAATYMKSFDEVFARNSERMYVVFFANDREIRPGGGFIGSFALVKVQNLQVHEWKIYDVYDADGQLQARVRPPEPISTYLNQPFFFLRDSAFTPDFPTNVLVAEDFLQKELGIERIDGALLFTFSSIENLVGRIGPLTVPEYEELISEENVYLKTQLYAEQNFFPGSTQKKNFLEALANQIILKLEEPRMAFTAAQSFLLDFHTKNMVAYAKDQSLQNVIDTSYWSGRQLPPTCIRGQDTETECIPLYFFPVEANLGVNKANAFVTRDYTVSARALKDTQEIETEFTVYFKNKSKKGLFPGGPYKNYYQVFLPREIQIQSIMIDTFIAKNPEIEQNKYTRVGLLVEIPEQSERSVSIKFRTLATLPPSESELQLIFQKQIGLPSSNVTFKFGFPDGYKVSDTNFSPLAVSPVVEYNSAVDSDKFFYLRFK